MKRDLPTFLLYALGFLLLWEWLRPIEQLTDTEGIEMFILFMLISFMCSFSKLRWIWQTAIKIGFILFAINRFYYEEGFFHFGWLFALISDFFSNMGLIFNRNWSELSNQFRSVLFFVLLWIMVYLIHYWLLNRQKIFIFFLMTIIYITVLDTFTLYEAQAAIVRTVIAGFAVMGMLTYYRILAKENVSTEPSMTGKWMRPLVLMITLCVAVGMLGPKLEPIWPDPVPYLKAAGDKGGDDRNSGVSTVGYGEDDSQLGGPFTGDDSIVFRYEANVRNYWKVETKDVYTGKGWIASEANQVPFRSQELVPIASYPPEVETTEDTASLSLYMEYNHLIYPAGIQRFDLPFNYFLEIDTFMEKVSIFDTNAKPVFPDAYTVEFKVPKYKASDLRKTTAVDASLADTDLFRKYTQLPEDIPASIKQLAEEITAGKTNWFDKAKAVERYFSASGFKYDQKNVAIPGDEEDYVEQFLFDTKIGYCDNFSTSMAVMLRTLGIPTRWVKGYTGGEFINSSSENLSREIYEVTNNNAHSWVEVYFPNQGWVPFEPTMGFTNEVSISYLNEDGTPDSTEVTAPPAAKPQEELPSDNDSKAKQEKSFELKPFWENTQSFFREYWKLLLISVIVAAAVAGIVYLNRGKWVPRYYLLRYRFKKKDDSIAEAYLVLLAQLERLGLKRKENQTLRSYARYIDSFFSSREMSRITKQYEEYLYHQHLPEGSWKETHELWENLIKKTIA
ncbi:transglutaminaseTgpA domain-containing protein [Neobacillus sp. FSL H8-0543]|uniref:transglutaminaseTgpA domain-containing protein n=1 Tax=Neobacillus sp. FSL H8-0543 TaxID=2954672 RepID=UPI0031590C87